MNLPPTSHFPLESPYRRLASALDALPNRFPPADDESHLRLLAKIFTQEEAALAAKLRPDIESISSISNRIGQDSQVISSILKEMAKKGLILFGKTLEGKPGFALRPFVVGIYEAQAPRMDLEMAQLFEEYYQNAFKLALKDKPQVHRVIPVRESIKTNIEVLPYESITDLINNSQSWGIVDCICRTQRALIGSPCEHPRDVCMMLSVKAGAFDARSDIHALDKIHALQTLERAASAGLVHCVSNFQKELWYICSCCTCSCSILRGMVEMGMANVVASSAFINHVEKVRCIGCNRCITICPFKALSLEDGIAIVDEIRCTGCGICVRNCPQGALGLERRQNENPPPINEKEWAKERKDTQASLPV